MVKIYIFKLNETSNLKVKFGDDTTILIMDKDKLHQIKGAISMFIANVVYILSLHLNILSMRQVSNK